MKIHQKVFVKIIWMVHYGAPRTNKNEVKERQFSCQIFMQFYEWCILGYFQPLRQSKRMSTRNFLDLFTKPLWMLNYGYLETREAEKIQGNQQALFTNGALWVISTWK